MDKPDPTFAWKQLYWSAIEEGLEPWEAAEHANRRLPREVPAREARLLEQQAAQR
ncbi:MAG TPA: hypothetical protein VFP70_02650 [Burkholderiales bacterium]|nr:hypothetical protein [Burkholderiales bacterium]